MPIECGSASIFGFDGYNGSGNNAGGHLAHGVQKEQSTEAMALKTMIDGEATEKGGRDIFIATEVPLGQVVQRDSGSG